MLFVKRDVRQIFEYRREMLTHIFQDHSEAETSSRQVLAPHNVRMG